MREQLNPEERATLAGIQAQMQANLVAQLFEVATGARHPRDLAHGRNRRSSAPMPAPA